MRKLRDDLADMAKLCQIPANAIPVQANCAPARVTARRFGAGVPSRQRRGGDLRGDREGRTRP
jgi:hypothetical protein